MAVNKIVWVLPQKKYNDSGISKYNYNLINIVEKKYSVKKIYVKSSKNFFENFLNKTFTLNNKLKKFRNKNNILFVPEEGMCFLGILNRKFFKKKIIIIHDLKKKTDYKFFDFLETTKFYFLKINYLFIKYFDEIITVSLTTQKDLEKKGHKSNIIYNLFHKPSKKPKYTLNKINPNKHKVLLNIGSEHSFKNITTIIKTMKLLKEYIFVKVGNPISKKNRNENIKLIKKLNLEKKVFLLNKVSTQKIYDLIFSSNIYIAPSYSEGFGRTTIEAQMFNKKIICSNITINREILGKTASYVKKVNNPYSWYKKY